MSNDGDALTRALSPSAQFADHLVIRELEAEIEKASPEQLRDLLRTALRVQTQQARLIRELIRDKIGGDL